jgi:hypothetical protein
LPTEVVLDGSVVTNKDVWQVFGLVNVHCAVFWWLYMYEHLHGHLAVSYVSDVNGLRFARRVRSLSSRGDVRRCLPDLGRSFTVPVWW